MSWCSQVLTGTIRPIPRWGSSHIVADDRLRCRIGGPVAPRVAICTLYRLPGILLGV